MRQSRLFVQVSKIPVIMLCLCLLATVGRAAEGTASEATRGEVDKVTSAPNRSGSAIAEPLSPQEFQELSRRAEKPGPGVVGGSLSNQNLTYIVIALAVAVIVLIAK